MTFTELLPVLGAVAGMVLLAVMAAVPLLIDLPLPRMIVAVPAVAIPEQRAASEDSARPDRPSSGRRPVSAA